MKFNPKKVAFGRHESFQLRFSWLTKGLQELQNDPKIFEHALYLADSSPDVTAYIGNNYYTDIVGAQNAGIYPVMIDPRNIFPDVECHRINKISDLVSGI